MRALGSGFLIAFALALVLTPFVRRLALRVHAFDPFSARKISAAPKVPRLGGIGVAAAFYVTLVGLWLLRSVVVRATLGDSTPVLLILFGGLPILAVGALDDLRGLGALPKLSVELLTSLLLWRFGLRIGGLPAALSCGVTVLWLVGVMNATNLIDGLDGLAGGVALFALASTAGAALLRGDLLLGLLVVVLAGAVGGFLIYNVRPASIFLGDAGSLFLGYLLGATAVWSVRKSATAVLLIFPVVALGLPLLDTSLTISRRLLSGRPLTQGDRDHVHHRLLGRFGVGRAVLILYGVCAVFSGLALAMLLGGRQLARLALGCAALFALLLAYLSGYLRGGPEGLWRALKNRRRNQHLLRALSRLDKTLAAMATGDAVRSALEPLSEQFGYPIALGEPGAASSEEAQARYPIGVAQTIHATLIVSRRPAELSPDEQALLQLLCDILAPRLGRLRR